MNVCVLHARYKMERILNRIPHGQEKAVQVFWMSNCDIRGEVDIHSDE